MPDHFVSSVPPKTGNHAVEEINRAMARFPFLVQILRELDQAQVPCPGDDDIRHGCERALTAMLCELARIDPAPADMPSAAEKTAQAWLDLPGVHGLVDADKLERMQLFIDCILNPGARLSPRP